MVGQEEMAAVCFIGFDPSRLLIEPRIWIYAGVMLHYMTTSPPYWDVEHLAPLGAMTIYNIFSSYGGCVQRHFLPGPAQRSVISYSIWSSSITLIKPT